MDIKIIEADEGVLFKLSGRIVLDECDRLKATILQFVNDSVSHVYLDLSAVDFIDSAGLGALVGIKVKTNAQSAKLSILNPSRGVEDILMVSKLDSIFDIATGADGEKISDQIASQGSEKSASGAASPAASKGPAMPSMPSSQPASSEGESEGEAEIKRLCRDAVKDMRREDFEAAAEKYESVLKLNPDYLPAHNNLAIVYEKKPEWHTKAIAQWKKVLELSSKNNDSKHVERAQKHLQNLEPLG